MAGKGTVYAICAMVLVRMSVRSVLEQGSDVSILNDASLFVAPKKEKSRRSW